MKTFRSVGVFLVFIAIALGTTNVVAEEGASNTETDPNNAVSFFAFVDPNSTQTGFFTKIGEAQVTPQALADDIRIDGDRVLRITSIQGHLFGASLPPVETDYALAFVGACTPRSSVRAFGNGYMAFAGPSTVQVTYRPGLVVSLYDDEVLCLRSLIQSNQKVLIEVHGYLQKRPSSKN